MRRIDLTPYKINTGQKPEDKLKDLLAMPPVAVVKRLATERLNMSEEDFVAMVAMETKPGANTDEDQDYLIRDSIVEILFHPNLSLGPRQLLENNTLATKIQDWPDNELLLEEAEYKKVMAGLECLTGLNRHDVEFVTRVLNASQVEVQAKPELQPATK